MEHQAQESTYYGERAITLSFGRYTAVVLPDIGGNLISFKDTEHGLSFLREPAADQIKEFKSRPMVYGIPVLFPPNRFQDGTFTHHGRVYEFPINEPDTHNHIHGFLHSIPWNVSEMGSSATESWVCLEQIVDERHAVYPFFPHRFHFVLSYFLSEQGLRQVVTIKNAGQEPLPCMLGFHTTVNVPFAQGSDQNDYRFQATIGERLQLDERMLPTGALQPLSVEEHLMKSEGINPFFASLDNHYTAAPQNGRNYMALTDTRLNIQLVYDVGAKYRYWMVWNDQAGGKFICPEPQMNLVNAPNTGRSEEVSGLVTLQPGETWSETSQFYVYHRLSS